MSCRAASSSASVKTLNKIRDFSNWFASGSPTTLTVLNAPTNVYDFISVSCYQTLCYGLRSNGLLVTWWALQLICLFFRWFLQFLCQQGWYTKHDGKERTWLVLRLASFLTQSLFVLFCCSCCRCRFDSVSERVGGSSELRHSTSRAKLTAAVLLGVSALWVVLVSSFLSRLCLKMRLFLWFQLFWYLVVCMLASAAFFVTVSCFCVLLACFLIFLGANVAVLDLSVILSFSAIPLKLLLLSIASTMDNSICCSIVLAYSYCFSETRFFTVFAILMLWIEYRRSLTQFNSCVPETKNLCKYVPWYPASCWFAANAFLFFAVMILHSCWLTFFLDFSRFFLYSSMRSVELLKKMVFTPVRLFLSVVWFPFLSSTNVAAVPQPFSNPQYTHYPADPFSNPTGLARYSRLLVLCIFRSCSLSLFQCFCSERESDKSLELCVVYGWSGRMLVSVSS